MLVPLQYPSSPTIAAFSTFLLARVADIIVSFVLAFSGYEERRRSVLTIAFCDICFFAMFSLPSTSQPSLMPANCPHANGMTDVPLMMDHLTTTEIFFFFLLLLMICFLPDDLYDWIGI